MLSNMGFILTTVGILGGLLFIVITIIRGEHLIRENTDDFRICCKVMLFQIFITVAGIGLITMYAPKH